MDENNSKSDESPEEPNESQANEEEQDGGLSQTPVEHPDEELTPLSGLERLSEDDDIPEATIETPEEEATLLSSDEPEEETGYETPEESGYQSEAYDTYSSSGPYEDVELDESSIFEDEEEDEQVQPDTSHKPNFGEILDSDVTSTWERAPDTEYAEESVDEESIEDEVETQEEPVPQATETDRHRLIAFFTSVWFMAALILAGIVLRGIEYWQNRTLSLSEAHLGIEILNRSWGELAGPIEGVRSAPIGFLYLVRIWTAIAGTSEYALRAYPLFTSCAVLVVLLYLGRRSVYVGSITIALALAALSSARSASGIELSPYAGDAFFAALLVWVCAVMLHSTPQKTAYFGLGAVGVFLVWMSNSIVFVLAGTFLVLLCNAVVAKHWKKAGALVLVGFAWGASLGVHYWVTLQQYPEATELQQWHVDSFSGSMSQNSMEYNAQWFVNGFVGLFAFPLGMPFLGLGIVGFLVGLGVFWKQNQWILSMLVLPMLFALTASYFGIYPSWGQPMHFAAPALLLVTACGLNRIAGVLWAANKSYACVLVVVLFFESIRLTADSTVRPTNPGVRPVVEHLKEQFEEGDTLYLFHSLEHEFKYYADLADFEHEGALVGNSSSSDWQSYRREIEFLKGKSRIWFALSRYSGAADYFESTLREFGTQMDKQEWGSYALYLYDMTEPSTETIEPAEWLAEQAASIVEDDTTSEGPLTEEPLVSDEMPAEDVVVDTEPEENSVEVPEN